MQICGKALQGAAAGSARVTLHRACWVAGLCVHTGWWVVWGWVRQGWPRSSLGEECMVMVMFGPLSHLMSLQSLLRRLEAPSSWEHTFLP